MGLRKSVQKIKPHFEKGGKYEKWLPIFESFETFLFVLGNVTPKKGCHIRDAIDLKRTMAIVVIAMIPPLLFGIWNAGYQHFLAMGIESGFWQNVGHGAMKVIPIVLVSYIFGLGTEFIFVYYKGKEIEEGYLVSGMLVPLIVPVDIPLWMVALASIFAVIIAKEAFGGTGMNIVNPALTARAFLFFAYPSYMSGDKIWVSGVMDNPDKVVDSFSGATPLAEAALGNTHTVSLFDMFFGFIPGSIGETSTFAILIGAAILLFTGVGSWKIITSVFAGGLLTGALFNLLSVYFPDNAYLAMPAYEHLFLGGFAFGAVYMATDPVTAAQTEKGKWIYGFLIGILAILVRVLNPAYPEGVMLAILLMNVFAPLIDHYVVKANIKRRLQRAKVSQEN